MIFDDVSLNSVSLNEPIDYRWKCYLLLDNTSKYSYVGVSIDPNRRLRQHNREIKGGARYTGIGNRIWKHICIVENFPNQKAALQFEWQWKHLTKKCKGDVLTRRLSALKLLLNMDRPTKTAIDFNDYPIPLKVIHF